MSSQPRSSPAGDDPPWRDQELLLMSEVMRLVGQSLATEVVLREMLHLLSELLGLNRGRIVLADAGGKGSSSIRHAYGLTKAEMAKGRYAAGEGITGAVLATGQPIIVQDIDAEPRFLARAVDRARLPQETVAFLAFPIEVNRRAVGVLAVHRIRRRHRLIADDVAVLRIVATLAGQLLQLRSLVEEKTAALEAKNAVLTRALESASARYGIIGTAPALLRALGELERVSQAGAAVLLLGESGTGKELFARAVHLASPRRDAIRCRTSGKAPCSCCIIRCCGRCSSRNLSSTSHPFSCSRCSCPMGCVISGCRRSVSAPRWQCMAWAWSRARCWRRG